MVRFFLAAYHGIEKIKVWAFVGLLALVAGLAAIVTTIEFDDDISSLIPANEETQRVQQVLKSIAFTDKIVVNIRKGETGTVDDLTRYASEFLNSLATNQSDFVKSVQGRVDTDLAPKTLDLVYRNLPLFLDAADYEVIAQKLSADSIAKITKENYRTLVSPTGIIAKKTIVRDPLGLSFIALKKLRQLGFGEGFKLKDGFLLNEEETNILLFIAPKFASGETNKNLPFSEALYSLQDSLNAKYSSRVGSEYFGAALSAVSNARQIKSDIQFTVGIALTLLILLLIVYYRKLGLPLILFTPTLFGGLVALAFLILLRDTVSALSLGIGAVLLGVTLDYGLHILTHIRKGESIKDLFDKVAPSIMMSSLTTACAFLCLLFLDAQALQDLGIFAAVSVLAASFFALLFIPQAYRTKRSLVERRTFLDQLAGFEWHKSKWAIAVLAVLGLISIFTYNKVVFEKDIAKLNYETQALLDARTRLEKLTDIGAKSLYLATYGADKQEVLQRNDSIFGRLQRLKDDNTIVSFGSIGSLVKSDRTQRRKIKAWQNFWDAAKVDSIKQNLIQSGKELGFKPNTFSKFYTLLDAEFEPLELSKITQLEAVPINDYIVTDDKGTTATSLIKVEENRTAEVREYFDAIPNTLLIDRKSVNESFLGNLKNDFNRLLGYSLVVVLLILYLAYRSFTLTLITSVPIFLTWFLTVGIMGLFYIQFNIFNIIICSFIFGLGVDYSIFMTNGMLTEYRTGTKKLETYRTSIILSVITTFAGVGVMVFAKHPVLYSVSVVSLIGIGCAMFVAFTLQPLLFRLFVGDMGKRPITPKVLLMSLASFIYFDLGGILLSAYSWVVLKLDPKAKMKPQLGLHRLTSGFMESVLYTNPFVSKKISNPLKENFEKPAMLIANHSSFLDILIMGMLHPKCIYLVKDHVYHSKVIGPAAQLHGAYPVSGGIEEGEDFLRKKFDQGFSIIAFPEGTRSSSNKIGRFHKGAFYLAERFGLDILPVIIHGCSEVSPKGSFIIRDGSINVELLPRISPDDPRFDRSYSKRPKEIGQYFRSEFRRMRDRIEGPSYWHKLILENYRFQGGAIYRQVKRDLKEQGETYAAILDAIGEKDSIVHLSRDFGQLDLLLALDSVDRKLFTYLEKPEAHDVLKNNYLTHNYSRITVLESLEEVWTHPARVLIVDGDKFRDIAMEEDMLKDFDLAILLETDRNTPVYPGFTTSLENDTFILLKKEIQ